MQEKLNKYQEYLKSATNIATALYFKLIQNVKDYLFLKNIIQLFAQKIIKQFTTI